MIYANTIPYFTLYPQRLTLPKGDPAGRGNLVCYYTSSTEETMEEINKARNCFLHPTYRYYYYNTYYKGKLRSRTYHVKDISLRKELYETLKKKTNLVPCPQMTLTNFNKNTIYEMSRFLQIFNQIMGKFATMDRVRNYWGYLASILDSQALSGFPNKMILIDADHYHFTFQGKLSEKMTNPLFMIYYTLYKDPSIVSNFDHDIYIFTQTKCIRVNLAKLPENTNPATRFKQLLMRLLPQKATEIEKSTEEALIKKEETASIVAFSMEKEYHFTGAETDKVLSEKDIPASPSKAKEEVPSTAPKEETKEEKKEEKKKEETEKKISEEIEKKAEKAASDAPDDPEEAKKRAEEELERDRKLIEDLYNQAVADNHPVSSASSARDKQIREAQGKIAVGDMTIDKLRSIKSTNIPIPTTDVSKVIKTTNHNMAETKFTNFEKTYNEKVFPKDMVNAFASLNNKSIPMSIIKYDVKDTSDKLNYKDTYTVVLEDVNRQRHTISVDIPKFIDNRYMWIGGSEKIILYQNFLYPVIKCGPDKVQIVTNYNKMFISRYGTKSITSLERLKKLVHGNPEVAKFFTPGYAFKLNGDFVTTVEYDELGKEFISFACGKTKIYFSQPDASEVAEKKGITIGDKEIFIGMEGDKPILIDQDTQVSGSGKSIVDYIMEALPVDAVSEFEKIKAPKRLMYSVAVTMKQRVSVGMLLGFWEGLSSVMRALKLEYRLERNMPSTLASNESTIRFNDCVLVYKETVAQSLIMNGLRVINTEEYSINEMETKEPYLDYFLKVYGKRSIGNALMNSYEFTIDPITEEILEYLNLPTKLVPLVIYANSLLADSQFTPDYDQHLCRLRTSEIIPAILYDAIAKNYVAFKNSNGKKKLSVPRDAVIKTLMGLKTVEDYSTLNPILEMERTHTTLYRGWRGINEDRSYTQDKRVYDKSMIGIIGLSTSPDGSVGVQKTLTMEPNVTNARGFLKVEEDLSKLKDVNLMSPAELMTPMTTDQDDPTRTGHSIKQSKHIIPVKKSSPVLISNGAEEVARFHLSSSFAINAADDGEVVEVNEKLGIIICKYKNGKCQAIDLNPKIVKNGGGGFYLSNHMVTNLKLGDKFKKNEMLAWHKDFFRSDPYMGNRMTMGTMVKIAITSSYNTYNDSGCITEKMSHDMATEMAFNRQVVVGKNATVDFIAQVGDRIDVGSSLIQFDTSFEDNELNKLLDTLSSELKEGVNENSRNNIQSKIGGVIEDIKMYSTVELSELSPSLQKIFGKYYARIKQKEDLLSNYDPDSSIVKCGLLFDETTGKVSPNKYGVIKGAKVEDGVLFEFYIKHEEPLEIASKIAYFTGIKATVSEIIPAGYEPYSEFRKDEEISTMLAGNSVLKRMTPSILLTSLGNKCLIELKRSLQELYKHYYQKPEEMKKVMTEMIYKFFNILDPSKTNTTKYQGMFEPMSPESFRRWFKGFFTDEDAYLTLDIAYREHVITMDGIEKAAKFLHIPLFEYVYTPHTTMDKNNVVRSRYPVPVGYIHVKRTQQTVAKKNGISTSAEIRSALTGQVTNVDKNGRESDLENSMLVALGLNATLKELNGPRADDMVAKREMLSDIAKQGYVRYKDLTYDVNNKTTLNTVNAYFLGMGLNTDLVTKGLMLKTTLKKEL